MSDRDVQDVRDMVARELEALKVQSLAKGPGMSEDEMLRQMKAKRLGLKPGVFNGKGDEMLRQIKAERSGLEPGQISLDSIPNNSGPE
jgi:hypothetical protein